MGGSPLGGGVGASAVGLPPSAPASVVLIGAMGSRPPQAKKRTVAASVTTVALPARTKLPDALSRRVDPIAANFSLFAWFMLVSVPRVLRVDPEAPDPAAIAEAAAVLARGDLVAFPTETVYGLGARGLDAAHVARIFVAKGRPRAHPLILHVPDVAMAERLASTLSPRARALAEAFWPGPLTLVLPRAPHVPDAVTGGLDTVAVRAPRHPVALALIRAVGEPLAAPSANAHMHVSPSRAEHVVASLGENVALVLDGGPTRHGIESTMVDTTVDPPRMLRPGALSLDALRAVAPDIRYETTTVAAADEARAAPGMAAKHYAPRSPLVVVPAGEDVVAVAAERARRGERVGVVVWSDAAQARLAGTPWALARVLPSVAEGYGQLLFAALYEIDAAGCEIAFVEGVPDAPQWWAVADRLRRASQR